tara:strand:+ start:3716 stop:4255 length:540 start_codon:yes stop_codon:yes gene_type:complete
MSVDSAYNLVASQNISTGYAFLDLTGMSDTYEIYYFSFANVKVASEAYLDVIPLVGGSVVSGTNADMMGLRRNFASGNPATFYNSLHGTREFIFRTGYPIDGGGTHGAYVEGYLLNARSSSHRTYCAGQSVSCVTTNKGAYTSGGFQYPTNDVFSGLRIKASTGNINNGKFLLYGLDKT